MLRPMASPRFTGVIAFGLFASALVGCAGAPAPEVAAVFVANHRAFLGFLQKRVGSRAIAEDLLQEAFVRGVNKAKADDEQSLGAVRRWRPLPGAALARWA